MRTTCPLLNDGQFASNNQTWKIETEPMTLLNGMQKLSEIHEKSND
jgi:hypothetical protein